MKKYISFLLVMVLLLSMMPVVGFAAEEPKFFFELSIDGEDTKEVQPGDIITVTLILNRTDANEPYNMYAMQDEIRYDKDFFRLVEDSEVLSNGVESNDIGIPGGYREFYMNFVSFNEGVKWSPSSRIGSFQLEVIAETGVSIITNEDFLVSYKDGSGNYKSDANFLTVIISTDCLVRFVTNGGTKIENTNVIYGEKIARPADPVREGKEFAGWYKDIHLTQPWDFDKDVVTGNMSLYAKWNDIEVPPVYYTLSLNSNGGIMSTNPSGDYLEGTEITLPEAAREGYTFTGWSDGNIVYPAGSKIVLNKIVSLTATWEPIPEKNVTVKLDGFGGNIENDISGEVVVGTEIVLPAPQREGYVFVGWSDGESVREAGSKIIVNEDITLTAVWREEKLTLSLNTNGGSLDTNPSGEYSKGSEIVLPEAKREGFIFKGWNDGNTVYVAGTTITLVDSVSLTAEWESAPAEMVTLKLDLNGGKLSWDPSGELTKGTVLKLPEPTRENFIFKGWKLGKVVYAAGEEITLNESMTFKASWEKVSVETEKVSLTLDLNGGTLGWNPTGEYAIGTVVKLPEPTRKGYTFEYWECNGKIYAATMEITLNASMSFKAVWSVQEDSDEDSWKPNYNIDSLITDKHINYVVGYPDGTILPKNNITRAEVAVIFYRLLSDEFLSEYETTSNIYLDVKEGMWHNKAISTLSNAGILTGYPDGTFQPSRNITRAELAAIIDRFAEAEGGEASFSDVAGHWAYENIATAEANGWINGYPDGTFQPNRAITRAETFAVVNRLLGRFVNDVNSLLPGMNEFVDNMNTSAWYYFDVQEATNNHGYTRLEDNKYEKWTVLLENIVY